jgi:hypothetical protein
MTLRIDIRIAAVAAALALSAPTRAQAPADAPPDQPAAQPASKEEVKALAEEVRRLKEELGLRDVEYASYSGMGPAASKVYFAPKGLSLGGYGEINYVNGLGAGTSQSDLYRLVLYTGYRFTDRIVFNAEVEFEHHDELSVEFAYLDFLLRDEVSLRVGSVLVPMGFVNLVHEPAFFNGVFRPEVERRIIPTTWNENGLGVHGKLGAFSYQAYGLVGLDAFHDGEDGLQPQDWLRGARTGGGESPAETLAAVASAGWDAGAWGVGASVYRGRAGQGVKDDLGTIDATVTLLEAHAQASWRGLALRGLWSRGTLSDAARIAAVRGDPAVLGSTVDGWYLEAAYDVLGTLGPDSGQALSPFVRWESLDLQAEVPTGIVADRSLAYGFLTAGVTYKPIPTVVVKADYQRKDPEAGATTDQVNVGVGLVF